MKKWNSLIVMKHNIKKLSSPIRTKIRSGIVISTVDQCVEELVFNAVDSGATNIAVRIDLGIFRIQVVDNGRGISESDMNIIGTRYATSKCHNLNDLESKLDTYGYRGETLASIIEVSGIVNINSRHKDTKKTYSKLFAFGKEKNVSFCDFQRPSCGTTITVQDFMYNMPVRRKLIKPSVDIEKIRIRLEGIALILPHVSLSLRNDFTKSKIIDLHRSNSILDVFFQLFGEHHKKYISEVNRSYDHYNISGFISSQCYHNKSHQFIYVNGRLIGQSKLHVFINDLINKSSITQNRVSSTRKGTPSSPQKCMRSYGIFVLNIQCARKFYDLQLGQKHVYVEFKEWTKIYLYFESLIENFLKDNNLEILGNKESNRHGNTVVSDCKKTKQMENILLDVEELDDALKDVEDLANVKRKVDLENASKNNENVKFLKKYELPTKATSSLQALRVNCKSLKEVKKCNNSEMKKKCSTLQELKIQSSIIKKNMSIEAFITPDSHSELSSLLPNNANSYRSKSQKRSDLDPRSKKTIYPNIKNISKIIKNKSHVPQHSKVVCKQTDCGLREVSSVEAEPEKVKANIVESEERRTIIAPKKKSTDESIETNESFHFNPLILANEERIIGGVNLKENFQNLNDGRGKDERNMIDIVPNEYETNNYFDFGSIYSNEKDLNVDMAVNPLQKLRMFNNTESARNREIFDNQIDMHMPMAVIGHTVTSNNLQLMNNQEEINSRSTYTNEENLMTIVNREEDKPLVNICNNSCNPIASSESEYNDFFESTSGRGRNMFNITGNPPLESSACTEPIQEKDQYQGQIKSTRHSSILRPLKFVPNVEVSNDIDKSKRDSYDDQKNKNDNIAFNPNSNKDIDSSQNDFLKQTKRDGNYLSTNACGDSQKCINSLPEMCYTKDINSASNNCDKNIEISSIVENKSLNHIDSCVNKDELDIGNQLNDICHKVSAADDASKVGDNSSEQVESLNPNKGGNSIDAIKKNFKDFIFKSKLEYKSKIIWEKVQNSDVSNDKNKIALNIDESKSNPNQNVSKKLLKNLSDPKEVEINEGSITDSNSSNLEKDHSNSNNPEINASHNWKEVENEVGQTIYINLVTGNSSFKPPKSNVDLEWRSSQGMGQPTFKLPITENFDENRTQNFKNNDFVLSHDFRSFLPIKRKLTAAFDFKKTKRTSLNKEGNLNSKYPEKSLESKNSDDVIASSDILSHNEHLNRNISTDLDLKLNSEDSLHFPEVDKEKYEQPLSSSKETKLVEAWIEPQFVMDAEVFSFYPEKINEKNPASMIETYSTVRPYKFTKDMIKNCRVLGQVDKKFIAITSKPLDGRQSFVALFDQHAADERVQLEKLIRDNCEIRPYGESSARRMAYKRERIPPLEIEFKSDSIRLMKTYPDAFDDIGLEYTVVNENAVIFHCLPNYLVPRDSSEKNLRRFQTTTEILQATVTEICENILSAGGCSRLVDEDNPRSLPRPLVYVTNSVACRSAIKFGDELSLSKCKDLIHSLSECQLPFQCAHGRPSLVPIADLNTLRCETKKFKPTLKNLIRNVKALRDGN